MSLGAALLLGLALAPGATPSVPPPSPPAPARAAGVAPARPAPVVCTRYRAQAEKNELVPEEEVATWASAALEKAGLLDPASPCFLHARITAGPIRTGGREDGWVAHVALSTRRYLKDGKLVTNEKGMLFVEPRREGVVAKARGFVEEFVAKVKAAPRP